MVYLSKAKKFEFFLSTWLGFILATLIGAGALFSSLPERMGWLQRGFWLDEASHNFLILESTGFFSLREKISWLLQPMLEFSMRKYLWFPIFGINELSLRSSSFFFSGVTILLLSVFGWLYFRKQGIFFSLIIAVFLGAWGASHPVEAQYSVEARHYSFVSLVSLLWCWSLLQLEEKKGIFLFLLLSAIFLNTHFFSFSLVACISLFETFRLYRENYKKEALCLSIGVFVLFIFTYILNQHAFREMIVSPAVQASVNARPGLTLMMWRVLADLRGLLNYFHFSIFLPFIILAAIYPLVEKKKNSSHFNLALRCLLLLLIAIPVLFLRIRSTSDYPYQARYYMPYFGLGFLLLLLFFQALRSLISNRWASSPELAFIFILAILGKFSVSFIQNTDLKIPSANYSNTFSFFERWKKKNIPMIFLASPCWCNDVPKIYWQHLGEKPSQPFMYGMSDKYIECVRGSLDARGEIMAKVEAFFKKNKKAGVIFYDCSPNCLAKKATGGVDRIDENSACFEGIEAMDSHQAVKNWAIRLGYPSKELDGLIRPFNE